MTLMRRRVIYSGQVQGVGFRYTTRYLATHLPVAGFVRNLPNGTVEVVVEGEVCELERFLKRVAERMASHIAEANVREEEPEGLTGFSIRS